MLLLFDEHVVGVPEQVPVPVDQVQRVNRVLMALSASVNSGAVSPE